MLWWLLQLGICLHQNKLTLLGFEPNGMALNLNDSPTVDVEVVGEGEGLNLGWVTPGVGVGTVTCTGTASPLLANYVVPAGGTFDNAYVNDDWNSGFSSVTANNLVFGEGSTYLVHTTALGFSPLAIAGKVLLPGAMALAVDKSAAQLAVGEGQTLVSAPGGVEGECEISLSGVSKNSCSVYPGDGALLFDYLPKSLMFILR